MATALPPTLACLPGFGEICDLVGSLSDAVRSIGDLVRDPFLWLLHHLFPNDLLNLIAGQLQPGGPDNVYSGLYRGMVPPASAVAAVCATARMVRSLHEERAAGTHLVVDGLLRFSAAMLLLAAPTPPALTGDGLPPGWQLIRLGVNGSLAVGRSTTSLLSSPTVFNADVSPHALVGRLIALSGLSLAPVIGFGFAIILLLVGIGIAYMAMIMVMRSIMLAFAIAVAPLCLATAVFDHRNRFCQWWLELFSAALLIPLVLGLALAMTTGFSLHFSDPLTSFLPITGILLGGLWFTGKAVHQLTWRHFSHGGVTGALTALSTTAMAAPTLGAQVGSVMAALGHQPRTGGVMEALASIHRGRPPGPGSGGGATGTGALARQAGELAASASAASPMAAAGADSGADFSAALPLGGGSASLGGPFNRAAGAALGNFATSPAGTAAVMEATAALPAATSLAERVAEYSRQLSQEPAPAAAVAGATLGSLMAARLPDLSRVLPVAPQPDPAA